MDHSEATLMQATERYVLGDLTVSEVEEFERHFFDCPQCSEELRMLLILQDNARAVFMEQNPPPSPVVVTPPQSEPAGWWHDFRSLWQRPWVGIPVMAGLAFAIFAGYQAGERRSSPVQEISAYPLYAASRGEETVISPPSGARFYELYMDRTWDTDYVAYHSVVRDEPGQAERSSMSLAAPAPGHAFHLLMPVSSLSAGRYNLVIFGVDRGGHETEVAHYPFTLRFQ